jgi:hypothetical protein
LGSWNTASSCGLFSVHVTRKGGGELSLVEEQIAVLRRQ